MTYTKIAFVWLQLEKSRLFLPRITFLFVYLDSVLGSIFDG